MRALFVTLTLPLLSLAACGGSGGGTESAGAAPPPSSGSVPSPTPTPTPTSTPTPTPTSSSQANLFDVTGATTFEAVGAVQSLTVFSNGATSYAGNASTVDAPSGTITYNPRDGIFTVAVADAAAGVNKKVTFQDPAHRSSADGARVGEFQVPLVPGFNYLRALDGTAQFTFFYQRPATAGSFVSLAGFERSELDPKTGTFSSEQGVMVFGTKTVGLQVPVKGAGRFEGEFLATMVGSQSGGASVLQWINGTSAADVDFAKRTVALSLTGVVGPAFVKTVPVSNDALAIASGATFSATGSASWAQAGTAFAGKFSSADFKLGSQSIPVDFTSVSAGLGVAGASSIDGTFYGPDAKNIGGNFRIVGGVPNRRIDILGAFAGGKK